MALFRLRTTGWGEGGNLNLASLFYGRPRRAASRLDAKLGRRTDRPYSCSSDNTPAVHLVAPVTRVYK